jgi:hypothetical protein
MRKRSFVRGISIAAIACLGFGPYLLLRVGLVNKFRSGSSLTGTRKSPRQPFYPGEFPLGDAAQSRISPRAQASKSNGQQDMGRVDSAQEEPSSGLSRFLCGKASFLCRFDPPWPSFWVRFRTIGFGRDLGISQYFQQVISSCNTRNFLLLSDFKSVGSRFKPCWARQDKRERRLQSIFHESNCPG